MAGVGADYAEPRNGRLADTRRASEQVRAAIGVAIDDRRVAGHCAGTQFQRRAAADQPAAFRVVLIRQQRAQRHAGKVWIAVVGLAIGVGQLAHIRQQCGRSRCRTGPSHRYRSHAAVRAVAGTPAPGSTGHISDGMAMVIVARPVPRPSPTTEQNHPLPTGRDGGAPIRPARRWCGRTCPPPRRRSRDTRRRARHRCAPRACRRSPRGRCVHRLRRARGARTAISVPAPCRQAGKRRPKFSTPVSNSDRMLSIVALMRGTTWMPFFA